MAKTSREAPEPGEAPKPEPDGIVRLVCVQRCQIDGEVYRPGDEVRMTRRFVGANPRVGNNFREVAAASGPPASARPGRIVAGLTREQALLKLHGMRVVVPADATDEEVARLYNAVSTPVTGA